MNTELTTHALPDLPQVAELREVVSHLWQDDNVRAIWIGGSLARGAGDRYSDVDLRIAVPAEAIAPWRDPDLDALFAGRCVGRHFQPFGGDAFLHHVLLDTGDTYDFFVQATSRRITDEAVIILGCRDRDLAARFDEEVAPAADSYPPVDADTIEHAIVHFCINTHKHAKVLHRDLDLLTLTGLHNDRATLERLWYALATGEDAGHVRPSIHGLTRIGRTVHQLVGDDMLSIAGGHLHTREAICNTIERIRDEVSRVGRLLADQLGFDYPDQLELTVRHMWDRFRNQDL